MLSREDLTTEQQEEILWLTHRTHALFFQPIGFGKTICALTAIQNIREVLGDWKVLVVSTKNICDLTWPAEIKSWEHVKDLTYASATGSKRMKAIDARPDVLGLNFENISWYYDQIDQGLADQREILIIDESSKMKSDSAKRVLRHIGKRIRRQNKVYRSGGYVDQYQRIFAMSATPCPESYGDLWSQQASISNDRVLGENKSDFNETFGTPIPNGIGFDYIVKPHAQRRIEELIAPFTRLPREADYMDLPDPIQSAVSVPWSKKGRAEYDELKTEFEVMISGEYEDVELDEEMIEVGSIPAKLNKLRQLCSGFAYTDKGVGVWTSDRDAKGIALDGIRERSGDSPLLVFYQYRAEAEYLLKRYPDAQVGLPDSLDAWNAGDVPMMCLHPRSAGHGLNLQHGGHIAVFYSMPYSYEDWFQAWGRLHRRGQNWPVSVLRLERRDSIEQTVWRAVQAKDRRLSAFLDEMRSLTR